MRTASDPRGADVSSAPNVFPTNPAKHLGNTANDNPTNTNTTDNNDAFATHQVCNDLESDDGMTETVMLPVLGGGNMEKMYLCYMGASSS